MDCRGLHTLGAEHPFVYAPFFSFAEMVYLVDLITLNTSGVHVHVCLRDRRIRIRMNAICPINVRSINDYRHNSYDENPLHLDLSLLEMRDVDSERFCCRSFIS